MSADIRIRPLLDKGFIIKCRSVIAVVHSFLLIRRISDDMRTVDIETSLHYTAYRINNNFSFY